MSKTHTVQKRGTSRQLALYIKHQVKVVDTSTDRAKTIEQIFEPKRCLERTELQNACEKIIFECPLSYGIQAEELIWEKLYYNVIFLYKRQKPYTSNELSHINKLLKVGIKHYRNFICRVQIKFGLLLDDTFDFATKIVYKNKNVSEVKWAKFSVHRSLSYLGNLFRYKFELNNNKNPRYKSIANRYYNLALSLDPEDGRPHNQMGILAVDSKHNIDAAFHYISSFMSKYPCKATAQNLKTVFKMNSDTLKQFTSVDKSRTEKSADRSTIEKTIDDSKIEKIADKSTTEKSADKPKAEKTSDKSKTKKIADKTNTEKTTEESKTEEITEESKTEKSEDKSTTREFTHTEKLNVRFLQLIEAWIFDKDSPDIYDFLKKIDLELTNCLTNRSPGENSSEDLPPDNLNKIIAICLLCLTKFKEDEDIYQINNAICFILRIYSKLINHVYERIEKRIIYFDPERESDLSLSEHFEFLQTSEEVIKKSALIKPQHLLDIISDEVYLSGIKIISDWLYSDVEVLKLVRAYGHNTKLLFENMSNLLNLIITFLEKSKPRDYMEIRPSSLETDLQRIPLPEEFTLKHFAIVRNSQKNLNWTYLGRRHKLSDNEVLAIRLIRLVAFGRFASQYQETGLIYNSECGKCGWFSSYLVETDESKKDEDSSNEENKVKEELPKGIKEVKPRAKKNLPCLVLDVDSLTKYLHLVEALFESKNFIILVPTVVLDTLEILYFRNSEAKEATWWLEEASKIGLLWSQYPEENLALECIKKVKINSREEMLCVQILEFCHYWAKQNIVTLLTGNPSNFLNGAEISYVRLTKAAGVNLELITEFYANWRKECNKHEEKGKK